MSGHIRVAEEKLPTAPVGGIAGVAPLMGWKPGRAFDLSATGFANVLFLVSVNK